MKKALALIICLVLLLGLTACGGSSAGGGDAKQTVLKIGLDSTLDSLDPWSTAKPSRYFVCGTLYQSLGFAKSPSSDEIDGVLMKEYKQLDDYTYEVTLYDYIHDAAGNPLKASDVIFSFNKYAEKNASNVESMEVVSDYVFTMTLSTAAPGVFQLLCQEVRIVTEKGFNDSGDGFAVTACGTSPYTLKSFEADSRIVLEKVADYWQTDASLNNPSYAANADVIEFHILTELTQLSGAIEQGTVQMICWADNSQLAELGEYSNLAIYEAPDTESRGIMLNMTESSPFYDNLKLRQAVLCAIDKEMLIENVTYGGGKISDAIICSGDVTIGFNEEWNTSNPYSYDPARAAELLKEAGYGENELTLRLLCNNNAVVKGVMQGIQANLMAIGINASVDIYDGSTYGGYRDGTSGMYEIAYCGAQMGGYVTKSWDTIFNGSNRDSGGTWAGLVDSELQGLYDTLTLPGEFTQENIDAFYNYITDNALYYQLFYKPTYCVYNSEKVASVYNDGRNFMAFGATELVDGYDVYAD